jgi:hypothetical protein
MSLPDTTAEFIIINPLHGRRGINGLSHTGVAGVLLSANYTTMLAPYNRVNVYDPRYRLALRCWPDLVSSTSDRVVGVRRDFMRTRRFGRADLETTPLGSGSWTIGGAGWGPQDD